MGWWNTDKDGCSFSMTNPEMFWGDGPADIIDGALKTINFLFEEEFGRKPTLDELIAGLKFSAC